ncbi:MAG: hypothetical protein KAU21_08310, partial [Gammaproteobacteria bacterium]|nr:hypothetical protein [Gammaproteobacteria bacterium]
LTALYNIIQCPVLETAGMLSPLVLQDLAVGHGPSLEKFKHNSEQAITGANLCSSLLADGSINMHRVITNLLNSGHEIFSA